MQRGHAPCGELKEKIRGSSSGMTGPWSGQANFSEYSVTVPSPSFGTVAAAESLVVRMLFDATGLQPGTYPAVVRIESNDPLLPVVGVPATMHVAGRPKLQLSRSSIDFGTVFLGFAANIFVTLALPASVMALATSNSFAHGLNPAEWIGIMRAVGKPYFALWVFLYVLMGGGFMVLPLIAPLFAGWLLLPVVNFVFIYFTLVMFNMMGYCLYQYHHTLGLTVKVDFDAAREDGESDAPETKPRDAVGEAITERIAAGDVKGALDAAYGQQRIEPENLLVQERYHKLLLLDGNPDRLLSHGRSLIALLLRKESGERALQVFKSCRELCADFALDDPGELCKLAQAARRAGDFKLALELVRGFDKRHPRHPDVPAVYLMSAQILSEHFRKDEMASLLLNGLIQKFPEHPLRAEAATYLKVIKRMAALRAAPKS